MKAMRYKIVTLFLALVTGLGTAHANVDPHDGKFKGKHTKEKTIRKEFDVNADALLKITNSYWCSTPGTRTGS